jgi:hypothetical protein
MDFVDRPVLEPLRACAATNQTSMGASGRPARRRRALPVFLGVVLACLFAAPAQAAFNAPVAVSPESEDSFEPKVAVAPDGHAVVAWRAAGGGLKLARRAAGEAWGAPEAVSGSASVEDVSATIVDGGGLTLTWSDSTGDGHYATAASAGAPVGVAQALSGARPALAQDAAGRAIVAYEDTGDIVVREGAVGAALDATTTPLGAGSRPAVAAFGSGGAVVAWLDASGIVQEAGRDPGAPGFGAGPPLSASGVTDTPIVAAGPTGRAAVAWQRGSTIEAAVRTAGTWGTAAPLNASGEAANPRIAVDEVGLVTAVYSLGQTSADDPPNLRVAVEAQFMAPADSTFGAAQELGAEPVPMPSGFPIATALAVAPDGATVVGWVSPTGAVRARTLTAGSSAFVPIADLGSDGASGAGEGPTAAVSADGVATVAWRWFTGSAGVHRIRVADDGAAPQTPPADAAGSGAPAGSGTTASPVTTTQPAPPATTAPPAPPAPTPEPAPQVVVPFEVLGLHELVRLRPSLPKRVVIDWGPSSRDEHRSTPRDGLVDPDRDEVRSRFTDPGNRSGYTYWSLHRIQRAVKRLAHRHIYVQPSLHPMPRKSVYAAYRDIEPYDVYAIEDKPSEQQAHGGGQLASVEYPAAIDVFYWDPEQDRGDILRKQEEERLSACAELNRVIGTGATFDDSAIDLIDGFRRDGCDVQVTFDDVKEHAPLVPFISLMEIGPGESARALHKATWARLTVRRPVRADLGLIVRPDGTESFPSLDQDWRVPAMPGAARSSAGALFNVTVIDRGARSGADGALGTPIAGVTVTGWFDPHGDRHRTVKAFEAVTRLDRDSGTVRTPRIKVRFDEPGTLRIEATGTPREGLPLQGWTELNVAAPQDCVTGVSGWAWRFSRDVSGYRRTESCGGSPRARAASLQGIIAGLGQLFRQLVGQPPVLDKPLPAPERLRRAQRCGTVAGQLALGAPLSTQPTVPTVRGGNVIASGGGNLAQRRVLGLYGATSSRLLDLGSDGVALVGATVPSRACDGVPPVGNVVGSAGGNVIAAGGGNVIAAGGGNVIAAGGGNLIDIRAASVIAAGGGNVIAAGGGNLLTVAPVIAAGGGNVIAAGGGNVIASGALN